jgi:hypothetical protein
MLPTPRLLPLNERICYTSSGCSLPSLCSERVTIQIALHSNDCMQKLVIHYKRVTSTKRWSDRAQRALEDGVRKGTARIRLSLGWSPPSTSGEAAIAKIILGGAPPTGGHRGGRSPSHPKAAAVPPKAAVGCFFGA